MSPSDSERFTELPPLTARMLEELAPGEHLQLVLLERTRTGVAVLFPVDWEHKSLVREASTDGFSATGALRLQGTAHFVDARLSGKPSSGEVSVDSERLAGPVKLAPYRRRSLEDFLADHYEQENE